MPPTAPRTLADQLRSWSDGELARLLGARPDLATPAPQDSSQLASRAGTRASVLRAVDQLTMLELTVLDAVVASGGTASVTLLQERVNAAPELVLSAVDTLRALALVWGAPEDLRALSVAVDVVGTSISGLGPSAETLLAGYGPNRVMALAADLGLPPSGDRQATVLAIATHISDRHEVEILVAELDVRARAILDKLERESTEGTVESAERPASRRDVLGPVDQLLTRGLLLARDRKHVAVSREVAICLRDGRTTREAADEIRELASSERSAELVATSAAGAAFELVRHVELLLEHWGASPPSALRAGGLGVRDLRATADLLHVADPVAALHVELAHAAGLVAVGQTDDGSAAWLPTDAFDIWNAGSVADRWTRLALAWLGNPRLTALVGGRDNGKPVNALSPDLERSWLPETRRRALEEVAELPDGHVLAAGTGVASLVERLRWLRPRRPAQRAQAVAWVIEEAAVMGLMALGGLAPHGRAVLSDADPQHAAPIVLEPLLPQPVDHVLLQADLTAVAPGPLEHQLAHNLATMADIESRGGATVYRFNEGSVRRAFDSGWSATEVHEFIASASRTPVPQPLMYLVDDISRKFGTVRVGAAESFLRSDDEAVLLELVHDPKAAPLRLRRIAPTVVVSDVPVDVLLPRLRELGAAPVVEAPDGTVRLARREVLRARSTRSPLRPADLATPTSADARTLARFSARIAATVTAIRSGDDAAERRPSNADSVRLSRTTPMSTLATLREAVEARGTVWIGYVDNHGSSVERIVDPVKVEGGWLSAYDHRSDEVRAFAVHRITGASAASDR